MNRRVARSLLLSTTALVLAFAAPAGELDAGDVTPPTLTNLSCAPTSVDVSEGAALVTSTAAVQDDASGVQNWVLQMKSPTQTHAMGTCSSMEPIDGDRRDGSFECTGAIGQYVETGRWEVVRVDVGDGAGNSRSYSRDDLAELALAVTVDVAK